MSEVSRYTKVALRIDKIQRMAGSARATASQQNWLSCVGYFEAIKAEAQKGAAAAEGKDVADNPRRKSKYRVRKNYKKYAKRHKASRRIKSSRRGR